MKSKDKERLLSIVALVVSVLCLTLGFTVYSSTLKIASNTGMSLNDDTFAVRFSTKQDHLDTSPVKTSSTSSGVTGTDGIINNSNSPTLTGLSATFTEPGQYVEYVVYARNEGKYKSYLKSINFAGEKTCTSGSDTTSSLVELACSSINMTVTLGEKTYNETTSIFGHALEPDIGEKVLIRISYDSNGERADGPFNITFGNVTMVYSSVDD